MNTYIRHFGSILDWANYSETDQSTDAPTAQRESEREYARGGCTSKAQSYHLLKTGYPEGLQRMKSILESIHNTITLISPQYEFANDIEGSSPDVQAYIEGRPDDMFFLSPVEKDAPPSFIRLQFDMGFASFVTIQQMQWAGATVFAAMECLRAQGCAVSLLMTHTMQALYYSNAIWQSQVPIPNNIDLDTLSFLITHPAVLRIITFSLQEHEPDEIKQQFGFYYGKGYGRPIVSKNPNVDVVLSVQRLSQMFTQSDEQNLSIAQRVLKVLVDTKLERIQ